MLTNCLVTRDIVMTKAFPVSHLIDFSPEKDIVFDCLLERVPLFLTRWERNGESRAFGVWQTGIGLPDLPSAFRTKMNRPPLLTFRGFSKQGVS